MDLLAILDEQWSDGRGDVADLLGKVGNDNSQLAIDLCASDLEWRWRLSHDVTDSDTAITRSAVDYRPLLGDRWDDLDVQRELYEAEWIARSLWGDQPHVDEFAAQLPEIDQWNDELAQQIDSLSPLTVTLQGESLKRSLSVRVGPTFVLGRQGTNDSPAPSWSIKEQRLVVANAHFRTISREQLRVRRIRESELELKNLSKVVPFENEDFLLQPSAAILTPLPVTLKVGELDLQFSTSTTA